MVPNGPKRKNLDPGLAKVVAEQAGDAAYWGVLARDDAQRFMPGKTPQERATALLIGAAMVTEGAVNRGDFMAIAGFAFDSMAKKGG